MSKLLEKHKRQPKIFIDLPSGGQFYDNTVLQDMQATNLAVYGMTAMDEIILKTPDALFSGEATVRVIQSCIPAILNPWALVGYDMDYILLALRIATYGDDLPIETNCPKCNETNQSTVSLGKLLESFSDHKITGQIEMGELTVKIAPIKYKTTTEFQKEQYMLERQVMQINSSDMKQEEKDKMLQEVLTKMTNVTLRLAVSYIDSITDGTDSEADRSAILDFIANNDAVFYKELQAKIKEISDGWTLPSFDLQCGGEECAHEYKSKINVGFSSFFGQGSSRSRNLKLLS